jgi:hypothetical protein
VGNSPVKCGILWHDIQVGAVKSWLVGAVSMEFCSVKRGPLQWNFVCFCLVLCFIRSCGFFFGEENQFLWQIVGAVLSCGA